MFLCATMIRLVRQPISSPMNVNVTATRPDLFHPADQRSESFHNSCLSIPATCPIADRNLPARAVSQTEHRVKS